MTRTGLHRPRRTRAASRRPAPDTRLLLTPSLFNTHYKRCPKAQRLVLRSDLSLPCPTNGRSPDKSRQALFKSNCQVSAPLIGRNGFAPSGDAQEHGVKLLHWATAPFSDSTVVTIGKLRSTNAGHGSTLPPPRVVEHFRWSRLPQSENFSCLVHTLSEVWGCSNKDSTVVTTGELPTTNGGHGSTLPSPRVVEHFRWARLPQSESFSRLVHVPSEVWGCRRVDVDVNRPRGRTPRIGTGVADFLHKPSGTFHPRPLNEHRNPDYPTEYPFRPRRGRSRACPSGVRRGAPRTANRPRMPSHTTPFTLSFRCPARSKMSKMRLGVRRAESPPLAERESIPGVGAGAWVAPSPTPREIPRKSLQASFNQNSYEFNQRLINVQSKLHPPIPAPKTRYAANHPPEYTALNTPTHRAKLPTRRGVAQSGSAPAWGAGGRWFKSSRPDHSQPSFHRPGLVIFLSSVVAPQVESEQSAIIAPNLHLAGG